MENEHLLLRRSMIRLDDLEKRKEYLEKIISYSDKTLADAPEGSLRCVKYGNSWHYFYRKNGDTGNGLYLNKNQQKLIKKLAQKKYAKQLQKKSKAELSCIDELIRQYDDGNVDEVYSRLSDGLTDAIVPVVVPDDKFLESWLKTDYPENDYYDEVKIYKSLKGERMRSKSEVIIADMLTKNDIPYLYEKPLKLNDGSTMIPDFTLLQMKTRQEIFWEHLGMMDDAIYSEHATEKIQKYLKNGIFPSDRLILTFESRKTRLDIESIEKMILSRFK